MTFHFFCYPIWIERLWHTSVGWWLNMIWMIFLYSSLIKSPRWSRSLASSSQRRASKPRPPRSPSSAGVAVTLSPIWLSSLDWKATQCLAHATREYRYLKVYWHINVKVHIHNRIHNISTLLQDLSPHDSHMLWLRQISQIILGGLSLSTHSRWIYNGNLHLLFILMHTINLI